MNDVTCGVPQASILSPLLVMLCVDDICDISDFFDITLFADDTTIICAHKDNDVLNRQVNIEPKKVCNWFCLNKLSLNIDKTNYMLFSNEQDEPFNIININNIEVNSLL